jgi:hypothetical protein
MTTNLQNAINQASQIKMTVKYLGARTYIVITPEAHKYVVRFETFEGKRYGRCQCKAGVARMACKHLVKAAASCFTVIHTPRTERRDTV